VKDKSARIYMQQVLSVSKKCYLTGEATTLCEQVSAFKFAAIWRMLLKYTKSKVKSNYFIVRPKVDQRTGLLSLPHLGNFRRTHAHHIYYVPQYKVSHD